MPVDLAAARAFMSGHARMLDRRRFDLMIGDGRSEAVLAAVASYRNPDGGYGWGLEPDLRDRLSQPGAALHAFEVFDEVAPVATADAVALCDWLAGATLPGGGLPFALPVAEPAACAPFWAGADPSEPSLHLTTAVLGPAVRVARHHAAVAAHPWLTEATRWCLDRIRAAPEPSSTLELLYSLNFLDALGPAHDEAPELVARWSAVIPASGSLPVEGGAPDELIRPLDFAPYPDSLVRRHLPALAFEADLDRLAAGQTATGGWEVDFRSYSPAAALEWNGYLTVRAIGVLLAAGRLSASSTD
jgi:hypothetical protein